MTEDVISKFFILLLFMLSISSTPTYEIVEIIEVVSKRQPLEAPQPNISSFDWKLIYIRMHESTSIENYKVRLGNDSFITTSSEIKYYCPPDISHVEFSYRFVTSENETSLYSLPVRFECGSRQLAQWNSFYKFKRNLVSVATAHNSIVTGSGLGPSVVAMTTYTVNVEARDSSNNPLASGGDVFKIKIYNKWTVGVNQAWNAVGGAKQVFASNIDATMTDNGDGTYSYSYIPNQSGEITVLVYLEDAPGVYAEHFSNPSWSGDPAAIQRFDNINTNWGSGDIYSGRSNQVSSYFYTKLLAPVTGTYSFTLGSDDGSDLILDGATKIAKAGTGCIWSDPFSATFTAGQLYLLKIKHLEMSGGALLTLSWSYPGQSMTIIPGKISS